MEKYQNLTNEQIALICAKDIVVTLTRGEYHLPESREDYTMRLAYRFYKFLVDPTVEEVTNNH